MAAILPFGIAEGRVLVIAPNLTIKDELYKAFDITNKQKCCWLQRGVLEPRDMMSGPARLDKISRNEDVQEKLEAPCCGWDLVVCDEAHTARELAYRLYTLCERKWRAAEALADNGLVQSRPEITRLAGEGAGRQAEQTSRFGEGED